MVHEIIWTPNVQKDLVDIVSYLQREWSKEIANSFIDQLYIKLDLISQYPHLGIHSQKFKNVYRVLITPHNVLYYEVSELNIILLDIFDTRQNPSKNQF